MGLKINGSYMNNIQFAADTVLIAECLKDGQMINKVVKLMRKTAYSLIEGNSSVW